MALRKAGVAEPKPGLHFEVNKLVDGGYEWIDLREGATESLAGENDPDLRVDYANQQGQPVVDAEPEPEPAKPVDRTPQEACLGDRVAITGRKGIGLGLSVVNSRLVLGVCLSAMSHLLVLTWLG